MKKFFLAFPALMTAVILAIVFSRTGMGRVPVSLAARWNRYRVTVEVQKPVDSTGESGLLLPLPMTDGIFVRNLELIEISPGDGAGFSGGDENRLIYWRRTDSDKYRLVVELEAAPVVYTVTKRKTNEYNTVAPEYTVYTAPSSGIESDNPVLIEKAVEIVGKEKRPFEKAVLIQKWIEDNIAYSSEYRTALETLEKRDSNCSGQSFLFVALCRATGIPARQVSGIHGLERKLAPDSVNDEIRTHIWAEYYLEGTGWIQAEPAASAAGYGWETIPLTRGKIVFENSELSFMNAPVIVKNGCLERPGEGWNYRVWVQPVD